MCLLFIISCFDTRVFEEDSNDNNTVSFSDLIHPLLSSFILLKKGISDQLLAHLN